MKSLLLITLMLVPVISFSEPVKLADRLTISSEVFNEPREILISLPESYDNNSGALYPVIFIARGQLDLLPVLAAIDMLDSEAPEFIVVGITAEGAEFIPNKASGANKYSELLHDEVVPYINKKYRTAPYSILVGHSAAGKFVANDWLTRGNDFSSYYAISPELNDGEINKRISQMDQKEFTEKAPLLMTMGLESKRMQAMFDELNNLETLKENVRFIQFEDQTHMSGRVHTVMAGLRYSFKNWRPSKKIESGKFETPQAHYSDLSKQYGYEVLIPLDTMTRQSAFHSASKNQERWRIASDIVKYAISKSASNTQAFIDISEEMIGYGMLEGSNRLVSTVCQQVPEHSRCTK